MRQPKMGRMVAAVIILVGAVLMVAALVMPLYSYEESGSGLSVTINFYPGIPSSNGTIQYSCSGISSCPTQTSYSNGNFNNTGILAETSFFLLIGGVVLGLIAGILGMASRGNPRRATPAVALAVIALVLALVGPAVLAGALPGAISKDSPNHPANGPWSSFFGSNTTSFLGHSATATWGPAIGWYLSIVAFVLFLVGVIVLFMARKEPPMPATAPPPMVSATSGAPPPSSPPAP